MSQVPKAEGLLAESCNPSSYISITYYFLLNTRPPARGRICSSALAIMRNSVCFLGTITAVSAMLWREWEAVATGSSPEGTAAQKKPTETLFTEQNNSCFTVTKDIKPLLSHQPGAARSESWRLEPMGVTTSRLVRLTLQMAINLKSLKYNPCNFVLNFFCVITSSSAASLCSDVPRCGPSAWILFSPATFNASWLPLPLQQVAFVGLWQIPVLGSYWLIVFTPNQFPSLLFFLLFIFHHLKKKSPLVSPCFSSVFHDFLTLLFPDFRCPSFAPPISTPTCPPILSTLSHATPAPPLSSWQHIAFKIQSSRFSGSLAWSRDAIRRLEVW